MRKVRPQLFALTFLISTAALSQKEEETAAKKISFEGSVDTYFRQNLDGKNGDGAIAPNTSFANLNGFALGMANVIASYKGNNVGFVADLVFGPRGEDATFQSSFLRPNGSSNIINQLYVYWNVSDKVTLTLGNFNTFLGYEVISPVNNFNYSTSYMFSYGPFSHTGIKADITLSKNWSAMLALMNNTDQTEFNTDNNYTLGAQLAYKNTFLNFLLGKQGSNTNTTFQVDVTTGHQISTNFYLGLNATYNDTGEATFYGAALYPQLKTSKSFTLGLRTEYFGETNTGAGAIGAYDTNGDANVFDFTLTGSYQIDNLTIKPEIRLDTTSEKTFINNSEEATKSLSSFVIAAIYKF